MFPIVEVFWNDATHCPYATHSLEEVKAHSLAKTRTVGLLLEQNKEMVKLAMTHFYDTDLPATEIAEEGFRLIWIIPRGCITKLRVIKEVE